VFVFCISNSCRSTVTPVIVGLLEDASRIHAKPQLPWINPTAFKKAAKENMTKQDTLFVGTSQE